MEDLDLEWSKFKLTTEEEEVVDFEEEIRDEKKEEIDLSLVEKFFMQNNINTKVMKTVMGNARRPVKGLVARELNKNLSVFQFFSPKDRDMVVEEGPWAFEGSALLVKRWKGTEQLSKLTSGKNGHEAKMVVDEPEVAVISNEFLKRKIDHVLEPKGREKLRAVESLVVDNPTFDACMAEAAQQP
ncbi:hypothetical protein Cgig2_029589 [Carnegiea gigantea]|uniref:DUF4283 domain-containing protein n=1 Tax=Carnegiea gigantea TaxID=171969 RepID=A0A9Q1JYL5_9CARY|nr:hypothetical protein Cgig2_029589 [Carnegiea gigantea]